MAFSNLHYDSSARRKMEASKHAQKRCRQRGIGLDTVPLVLAFGRKEFDGKGGIRYVMTGESVASLRRVVGSTQQVDALAGVYAVVSTEDQTVITVGHRYS